MKKSVFMTIGIILITGFCIFGCGSKSASESKQQKTTTEASDKTERKSVFGNFTTTDLNGTTVDQSVFKKSKLSLVNIWGTFCTPCLKELPFLESLAKEYKGRVQLIGIVGDASKEKNSDVAKQIVKKTGVTYLNLLSSQSLMENYLQTVMYYPTTVFVDENGRQVGDAITRANSLEQWKSLIEKRLKEV